MLCIAILISLLPSLIFKKWQESILQQAIVFAKYVFITFTAFIFGTIYFDQIPSGVFKYFFAGLMLIIGFLAGIAYTDDNNEIIINSPISKLYNRFLIFACLYLLVNSFFITRFGHIVSDVNLLLCLTVIAVFMIFPNTIKQLIASFNNDEKCWYI